MNINVELDKIHDIFVEGAFVAGGAVLSKITKQPISDYDIYPKSRNNIPSIIQYLLDDSCFVVNVSNRAITLKSNNIINKNGERAIIQVMTFDDFNTAEKIFSKFDFSVCMVAYDFDNKTYHFGDNFWKDVASRSITFNPGTAYPLASMIRVHKYKEKGYNIGISQMTKIGVAVSNTKIESYDDLAESIGGQYGEQINTASLAEKYGDFSIDNVYKILDEVSLASVYTSMGADYEDFQKFVTSIEDGCDFTQCFFVGDYVIDKLNNKVYCCNKDMITLMKSIGLGNNPSDDFDGYVYGYKVLKPLEDGTYQNTTHHKKYFYKIGVINEELNFPNLYVFKKPTKSYKDGNETWLVRFKLDDVKDHPMTNQVQVTALELVKRIDETNENEEFLTFSA